MGLMTDDELKKQIEKHKNVPKREMLRRFLRGKDRFDSSLVPDNKLEEFQKEVEHAKAREALALEILKMIGDQYCDRCGKCCEFTYVSLDQRDLRRISRFLKMDVYDFADKYLKKDTHFPYFDCPCPFFERKEGKGGCKGSCKIYYVRPEVCKLFPFGDSTMTISYCDIGKYISDMSIALGFTISEDRVLAEIESEGVTNSKRFDLHIGEMKETGSGTVMVINDAHLKIILKTVKRRFKK